MPETSGAPIDSALPGDSKEPGAPEPAIRGRFALFPQEPKGAIIGYATGICERCAGCGCGDRQEPLDLTPGGVMKMMGKMGRLKGLVGL